MQSTENSTAVPQVRWTYVEYGLPRWLSGFDPWVRKIPWRRKWQPTPVFLPRKLHGQRSLSGYSPWGCKKLDTTEQLSMPVLSIPTWKAQVILLTEESLARKQGIRFDSIHVNA